MILCLSFPVKPVLTPDGFARIAGDIDSVRAPFFPPPRLAIHVERARHIEGTERLLMYQTRATHVDKLDTSLHARRAGRSRYVPRRAALRRQDKRRPVSG
jgi:hypothetical protein